MHLRFCNPRRSQGAPEELVYKDAGVALGNQGPDGLLSRSFQDPSLIPLPIAVAFILAFVVGVFALGQCDFHLDPSVFPIHGGGHQCEALSFDRTYEMFEFGRIFISCRRDSPCQADLFTPVDPFHSL